MRYWLIGLFCTSLIAGCNGEDVAPTNNQNTDETVVTDKTSTENINENSTGNIDTPTETIEEKPIGESPSGESTIENVEIKNDVDDINFSQIGCNDELTPVLALVNKQRSQPQMCGNKSYSSVNALTWSTVLTSVAQTHSNNMANYNFFSHTGLDNSSVSTRVTAQNYNWSWVAENIAAGQRNAQTVVDAWMKSEGHCKNIMNPNVTEMGLACSENRSADYPYYWTQVFAKPR